MVLWFLLGAFIVFALLNGLLLVSTQGEAVRIAKTVKAYIERHESDLKEFLPALKTFDAWSPWWVGGAHILVDAVAVAAILIRLCPQLRVYHGPVGWEEVW